MAFVLKRYRNRWQSLQYRARTQPELLAVTGHKPGQNVRQIAIAAVPRLQSSDSVVDFAKQVNSDLLASLIRVQQVPLVLAGVSESCRCSCQPPAFRLPLDAAQVQIQRLQEISDGNAIGEGFDRKTDENILAAERHRIHGTTIQGGRRRGLRMRGSWDPGFMALAKVMDSKSGSLGNHVQRLPADH